MGEAAGALRDDIGMQRVGGAELLTVLQQLQGRCIGKGR
jgi:hypothetical protein